MENFLKIKDLGECSRGMKDCYSFSNAIATYITDSPTRNDSASNMLILRSGLCLSSTCDTRRLIHIERLQRLTKSLFLHYVSFELRFYFLTKLF